MKNKKNKKVVAAVVSLSSAACLLAGGTFAWYVVSNTATANVGGQSVAAENMHVGIKSAALNGVDGFTLDTDKENVYWYDGYTNAGATTTNLAPFNAALKKAIGVDDADTNKMIKPVTSGKYDDNNVEIKLYNAPKETDTNNVLDDGKIAPETDYIEYTLAFNTVGGEKEIYLNRAMMNFVVDNVAGVTATDVQKTNLLKSIRVGIESTDESGTAINTIFAPYSNDNVTTDVGGYLDLNADGVKDYAIQDVDGQLAYVEKYYGEIAAAGTQTEVTDNNVLKAPVPNSNRDAFMTDYSVTDADSRYQYKTYSTDNTAATQIAHGMNYYTYAPGVAGDDYNHPVAISDTNGYAEVTIKLWLEGWDKACINGIENAQVSATMAFVSPDQDLNRN